MVIIGADHAGFELKNSIKKYFGEENINYLDVTDYEKDDNDDYTDIAIKLCKKVLESKDNLGIAICGTGIGISVACNKIKGIIAAPCFDEYTARMVRQDNNANVLCLGGRLYYAEDNILVKKIVKIYLETNFLGQRHLRRVDKIKKMEDNFGVNIWE